MSGEIDGLLARSRAPGRFVERRRFTLSREKAVEKLREFSLRHPEQYILELVQAAVFAGARWIAIDVSKERLFFAWVGGRSLAGAELENVFDYLFADRSAAETRHVVQLAVALNALLQRRPKVVRIESGDGTAQGTVRMDLGPDGTGQLGRPEEPFQGTYLVVEHATSWFQRFEGDGTTREQALVEEHCLYSPVPILLNYRAPFGYRANRTITLQGVPYAQPFDQDGRRGALGLPVEGPPANDGVRLVVGGVWITTRKIDALGRPPGRGGEPRHMVGVICDDRLRKTADQGDVVEDARFVDMLHDLQPLCTALIRRGPAGAAYTPPALPRRVSETAAAAAPTRRAGPEPQPLPERIEQVAPRPALTLPGLVALPAGTPVFWVDADTAGTLGLAADPERFPFRLLVLSPGQAVTLAAEARALSLGHVTSAADAEFVSRVFSRQAEQREVVLPFDEAAGLGGRGRLFLRLHVVGAPPAWGQEGPGDVPVSVRLARRATWCGAVSLGLPGVSVAVEVDGGHFDPTEGPVAVSHLVRRNAWRLLVDAVEGPAGPAPTAPLPRPIRALAVAVLAMSATPHFHQDAAGIHFAVALPRDWGTLGQALRRLPLAPTTDGALCFDDLVARVAAGASSPAGPALLDPLDLDLLEPLELRLGPGHLDAISTDGGAEAHPSLEGVRAVHADVGVLLAVVLAGRGARARWTRWRPEQASPGADLHAVLWLADRLRPRLPASGWRLLAAPLPAVGLAVRGEADLVRDQEAGLRLLYEEIARTVREDQWAAAVPDPARVDRARQLGRLALVALAAHTGHRAGRVLPASDGVGWRRLEDLAAGEEQAPRLRIAPRNGPRVAEADTVLLTWDELQALAGAGLPLPLRFDDAPEVWDSLASAQDPAAPAEGGHGWLLRERLRIPGLDGWLGLRWPYDPTSAVLVQQSGELVALTQVDRHVPCHGLAWSQGATDGVGRVQRDLLELARLRLYQLLAARLELEPDPRWRAEAERYAIDYAVHAWRERGAEAPGGTAARLLHVLRLQDGEGRPLGTLGGWLGLPPDRRPVPAGHAARYVGLRQVEGPEAETDPGVDTVLAALERRLGRVLALACRAADQRVFLTRWQGGPRQPVARIRDDNSGHAVVALDLNDLHPLAQAALAGPGQAREILLLEAARLAIQVIREDGGQVDLLNVHQLLAAQRP